jgi:flagellar hook assembly protein FlgD
MNVAPGTYDYRLIQMDLDGSQRVTNSVRVAIDAPTDFILEQNYPNPSSVETRITFTLPTEAPTTLDIFNALGVKVRTLAKGVIGAGIRTMYWNGKDDNGAELPVGTYVYTLASGEFSASRKLVLTR